MDLRNYPNNPGVYLMKNNQDKIIYIGKSTNLKKRLLSYFTKENQDIKTHFLVEKIKKVDIIVTQNAKEALILENQLIKKYKPHYNIQLKDGKSYISIAIDYNSPFPRIYTTREKSRKKVRYFGPYPSSKNAKSLVQIAEEHFFLRQCKISITNQKQALKNRPCSLYSMNKCYGACIWKETPEDYQTRLKQFIHFLNGRFKTIKKWAEMSMHQASQNLYFEQAAHYRDLLYSIEDIQEKQKILFPSKKIIDLVGIHSLENKYSVVILRFLYGVLHSKKIFHSQTPQNQLTVLKSVIEKIYINQAIEQKIDYQSIEHNTLESSNFYYQFPDELILPVTKEDLADFESLLYEFNYQNVSLKNYHTVHSHLNHLIEIISQNTLAEWKKQYKVTQGEYALLELQKILNLPSIPYKIETFDISNIEDYYAVGSCVSFVNASPDKEGYRIFKIKSVEKQNDFAMLYETIHRRFQLENTIFPDLIVIDGGKGQVSSAQKALIDLNIKISIIGLSKKKETIILPYGREAIQLAINHPSLQLLTAGRDEAHRFANALRKKLMLSNLKNKN